MITCVAMILGVGLSELPALALNVESEARTLSAQTEVSSDFIAKLNNFSNDAERLSASLRQAGVAQDMPCIFHGIAQDAQERVAALQAAHTEGERRVALNDVHTLLGDTILIAPMAAGAAADRAVAEGQPITTASAN